MDIMLDIETMGAKDDAMIVSIGAVAFNVEGLGDTFYEEIPLDGQLANGRTMDLKTLEWWLQQSEQARMAIHAEGEHDLHAALYNLRKFIQNNMSKKGSVWANGAMFDFRILRHAYKANGMGLPWSYGQECCIRALRRLDSRMLNAFGWFKTFSTMKRQPMTVELKTDAPVLHNASVLHNALYDAVVQAKYVRQWLNLGVGRTL